ncbi:MULTISPECIES: LysR family transcriptional regulator [Streptomyces]|uniref:LysR family transcriptional regulator n=1 Tax=Streptomyces TaxID=1883 RepID=UPI00178230A5|nr:MULTISPECIES: LysR family transcriptional regulator [Streptomyces]GHE75565.1 LysR family transcriptional regulator [Streptomyces griseoaurantiacus]MDX3088589.1 LysR family transcriptional regulator [Streptomyces sp. ME12-02E]MDX3331893.1 LysR family transcriptional regulator [Streptomyces sp. ME02-6978a]MDX3363651.1 LysR family transcriptional regulator [Streptomyces sp. ME02-6978.2a]WTI24894.1 LysR family transcriptional regulator [Streptomyces jietaisiensis]
MAELETRELEYFVAVAEELHFGRAATRLAIAQPALSKAVRRLESRLGTTLLHRSSRQVALTPAGEALLTHGRHALNAVGAAAEKARRAGDRQGRLRLVIKAGGDANLLSGILAAYARRPDARQVDVLFGGATDRADHVRDGRADAALLYVPFDDTTGLHHETLAVEGRVAILPPGHRLASRPEITLADLAQEALPRWKGVRWTGAPEGRPGPEVEDGAVLLDMIRLGRTVAVLPRSLALPARPGLVYRPVADAARSALVVAWAQDDRRPLVASFVAAAVEAAEEADGVVSGAAGRGPAVPPETAGPP